MSRSTHTDCSVSGNADLKYDVTRRDFLADLAAVSGLLALSPLARGATTSSFDFYVSPNGNDANAGTSSAPWSPASLGLSASSSTSGSRRLSTQAAANQAKMAGKRIGLLPGNYVPATFVLGMPGGYGNFFDFTASGPSPSQPTILQSTTPQGAVFSMSKTVNGANFVQTSQLGELLWLSCNNVVLDGVSFNYANSGGFIRINDTGADTGNNITIQNCSFRNLDVSNLFGGSHDNVAMIELHEVGDAKGSGLIVQNCYFNGVINGGHTIDSLSFNANCIGGFQFTNITIDHCEFVNAFSAFYPKGKVGYFKFTNNFIHDCMSVMRDANQVWPSYNSPNASVPRNVIANNVAINVNGLSSGQGGNPAQCNVDIYNNTIVFNGGNDSRQFEVYSSVSDPPYGSSPSHTTSTFYNNILAPMGSVNSTTYYFSNNGSGGTLPYNQIFKVMDYNCHSPNGFSYEDQTLGASGGSLAAWRSFSGYDTHSLQANPQFVATPSTSNPATVKLNQSTSPVRAGGSNPGRIGGASGGAATDMGAWGGANPPSQIGCNLTQSQQMPGAPALTVS